VSTPCRKYEWKSYVCTYSDVVDLGSGIGPVQEEDSYKVIKTKDKSKKTKVERQNTKLILGVPLLGEPVPLQREARGGFFKQQLTVF
jgi:hypothetical protein